MISDPFKAPDHIRYMGSKYTSVYMHLVKNNKIEIGKEFSPLNMVGKDPEMKHVWITDYNLGILANLWSSARRCVAII